MAIIRATRSGAVTLEILEEIGHALESVAEPFDPDGGPGGPQMVEHSAQSERMKFSDGGVSAVLKNYELDGMRVEDRRATPFRDGVFQNLMPSGATGWEAGFDIWGKWDTTSWSHSYLRVSAFGGGTLNLTAFSPDEAVATQIIQMAREVIAQHPVPDGEFTPETFNVFVAFGGGRAWEVVRDYLKRAGIKVVAFTEVERAGQVTLDVVTEMIHSASMAVIVMTATDAMADGSKRARQNVIHETGFAQGALGTRNVIILLEKGTEPPSNIAGVTYIPFEAGEIHTTESRVVELLKSRIAAGS